MGAWARRIGFKENGGLAQKENLGELCLVAGA